MHGLFNFLLCQTIISNSFTGRSLITGLKWTRKTPPKIAQLLEPVDIPVSANTLAGLLHSMNDSLRANRKNLASDVSLFRDQQFQYISSLRHRFQRHVLPMISVNTKKRELVGNFNNAGVKWDRHGHILKCGPRSWRTRTDLPDQEKMG